MRSVRARAPSLIGCGIRRIRPIPLGSRRKRVSSPLAPYHGGEIEPGAAATSDAEIAASVRATAQTIYHPVGTCKMGSDALGVVDATLRVRGIESLRVVDASIMPTHVRAHPYAAVIMIGEKAADLILG